MGKNNFGFHLKRNNDSDSKNLFALALAFLFGVVTAFVAFWGIRGSKDKKGAGASGGGSAAESDSARTNRELQKLAGELRAEIARRRREDSEARERNSRFDEERPIVIQPQQIKPYRPRRRMSAWGFFGRAVAVTAAAALVVTGVYMVPDDKVPVSEVQARESFGGIGQVVEEHNEDNPFVILDIVPGKAQAVVNGRTYDFSLGTIGYLAPGQSPIQQDLTRIFKGSETEQNTDFYDYAARKELTDTVISGAYGGITYQEAYAGTGEELKASQWSQILDSVEVDHDENGRLTDGVYPTGRLYAHVQKRSDADAGTDSLPSLAGFDYNLTGQPEGSTLFSASAIASVPEEGVYTFAEGQGNYHVVFGEPAKAMSGYRASVLPNGSGSIEKLAGNFSETTGIYKIENGVFVYAGRIGNYTGTVGEDPQPKPVEPEEPTDPENPADPVNPDQPTEPTDPEQPTGPENPAEPTNPEQPTDPETPAEPTNPEEPADPTNPEQPADPVPEQPQPEQPTDPVTEPEQPDGSDSSPEQETESVSAPESVQSQPVASAFRTRSILKRNSIEDGWYLCVGTEPAAESNPAPADPETPPPTEPTTPADPVNPPPAEPTTPAEPVNPNPAEPTTPADPVNPNPTEPTTPADPVNPNPTEPITPETPTEPINPGQPENPMPELPEGTYCVLKFTYVPETDEEQFLYQIQKVRDVEELFAEEGAAWPYDSYSLEESQFLNKLDTAATDADVFDEEPALAGQFEYVGDGRGMYKITRSRVVENVAAMTGTLPQDVETPIGSMEETDAEDGQDASVQAVSARAAESSSVYYIEVQNAPVYIRCTGGNDFLRRYVFNSLSKQDNASDDFAIKVNTVLAGELDYDMVQEADLVYLEDGMGLYLNQDAKKIYLKNGEAGSDGESLADIGENAISRLLYGVVQEAKPVIVDYGIIEDTENYGDSNYQRLAKAFLKQDLLTFYNTMEKSDDLVANILMNVDSDDFPNKKDNDYHYVNRNVYIVNGTPLVGDDFPEEMGKDAAKAGFGEVLAAIRAENVVLSEDERISEKVSRAKAVQYIINYSLGLVGEYKNLSILELQPTANIETDLYISPPDDKKKSVVLYWQKKDQEGTGQQILRSAKDITADVVMSSVAAFNTSHQDINADYNMIFIGLDAQRFYHERDKDRKMAAVFNDEDLNGKVYHRGDTVPGSDIRYDANDITEQKKEELLDYLRAGYPIVVENDCFVGRSAKKADEDDINTDYIASDTQMYDFFRQAISMGRSEDDEDDDENGVGIYTIEDVHSSAMFTMQLNAMRPRIELRETGDNAGDEQAVSDIIATESVPEKPGILRGTIEYRITSDREGEDKTYRGSLDRHLYLDLNYDGVFAPEEEFAGYEYEESEGTGRISVDFNEINFGIVPWKLEVTDSGNKYRRAQTQGCFTISGSEKAEVRVLQILNDTVNRDKNFQTQFEEIENSTLAHFLSGAEAQLNMNWDLKTVKPSELETRLKDNPNYLSRWDVVALGFGDSGSPGNEVMEAVNAYIEAGGSVVVSSAGASAGRAGLSAGALGQKEEQTYGRLSIGKGPKLRYEGMSTEMLEGSVSLLLDRVNDGTIARWPYEIDDKVELSNITSLSVPDYLLDIGTVRKDGESAGEAYTTAWFTLNDQEITDNQSSGGYSVSPRDGRNNYYIYSKGNVVYVGQSVYPYYFEKGQQMPSEGNGIDECKIFVNALMAAYNAGVHRANVSIVAGFNGKAKVESVTVPFDVAFKESKDPKDAQGGILGDTVDVYFRFTDNNIAFDKVTKLNFYYKNAGVPEEVELLTDGKVNAGGFTEFSSPVWSVENNRLVEVTEIVSGKTYRIKAPLTALQTGEDRTSQICVLLTNEYTRAGQTVQTLSTDSVALTRAQMFLLE